ncbi:MAG: redoxin domain-containing protein [Kineosporiaceae bacterium]
MTAETVGSAAPAIGAPAPRFTLPDQDRTPVTPFGDGRPTLVVFLPFAFSGICTGELCELRDDPTAFADDRVRVLAVSCDSVHALRAWREAEGYSFSLLSDFWPHGAVGRAYGVFDENVGASARGSFLVDGSGVLRWSQVNGLGEARDVASYREALAAL